MKRLLILTLVLVLLMVPTAAFGDTSLTMMEGLIPQSFTLASPGKLNPAETFTYEFSQEEAQAGTNLTSVIIPDTIISYELGATGARTGEIDLTNFASAPIGRYTYRVTQQVGDTAGMNYSTHTGTLVVDKETNGAVKNYLTIRSTGETPSKHMNFDTTFSAGDLTIAKTVTGNLGDYTKLFDVTVTLQAPEGKTVQNGVMHLLKNGVATEPAQAMFSDGEATVHFQLKHNETFIIKNLPYGVTYTVVETEPGAGYEVSYDGNEGTIAAVTQHAAITNHKSSLIPTGISFNSVPYTLMLIGAIAGLAYLALRRRKGNEG